MQLCDLVTNASLSLQSLQVPLVHHSSVYMLHATHTHEHTPGLFVFNCEMYRVGYDFYFLLFSAFLLPNNIPSFFSFFYFEIYLHARLVFVCLCTITELCTVGSGSIVFIFIILNRNKKESTNF